MNQLIMLDIAEVAISHVPSHQNIIKIKPGKLYKATLDRYPTYSKRLNFNYFKLLLGKIYPIHKNLRSKVKICKIDVSVAYRILSGYGMILRPSEHIKRCAE